MKTYLKLVCTVVFVLAFVGCADGGSGKSSKGNPSGESNLGNRFDWKSIPRDFNPEIDVVEFGTENTNRILLNLFGFDKDVGVIYSNAVAAGTAQLHRYVFAYFDLEEVRRIVGL